MASFDPFLDALPEQVARQVARDNFLAVLPRQPADPRGRITRIRHQSVMPAS